jgi:hypothetical protein
MFFLVEEEGGRSVPTYVARCRITLPKPSFLRRPPDVDRLGGERPADRARPDTDLSGADDRADRWRIGAQ